MRALVIRSHRVVLDIPGAARPVIRRATRAAALVALSFGAASLSQAQGAGTANAPARRATPTEIKTARFGLMQAIAGVSRNESAFLQALDVGTGCDAALSVKRMERVDSVRMLQRFDAGTLSAAMTMQMDRDGGIIHFVFPTVNGAKAVARERAVGTPPVPQPEQRSDLTILVAETSQQVDVQALIAAWKGFVRACGGDA